MKKVNKISHRSIPAFTLAEVLIALVIIGIVAAVTIPAIIQQTQKQEYVAGLKKAYSTLQNSLYKIADNNGYSHGDYSFLNNTDFIDEFAKVANIVKKCDTTADCFPSAMKNRADTVYKLLNGNNSSASEGKSVVTNDGQIYTFYRLSSTATTYGISNQDKSNAIGRIIVDLNGWKKPNQYGYDTFWFYVVDGKGIIPAGIADSSECNKTANGVTCAAKVLKENKIDY